MQKKSNNAFDIGKVKDPELREYLQRLTSSLNRQNQELKALVLKDKILNGYFETENLQQSLALAANEFKMPGCSSLRILVQQYGSLDNSRRVEAVDGDHTGEYAYLDEQIIHQLQEKDQLVINDTSKVHSIKFSPEQRYPRAIGAFRFAASETVKGYLWISFEAVKEFTNYELERLTQFGQVLGLICENSSRIAVNRDSAAVFESMLALVDIPVVLIGDVGRVSFANPAAQKSFNGNLEAIPQVSSIADWLAASEPKIQTEVEIANRHYQVRGEKLENPDIPNAIIMVFEDDTVFNRKQTYLTLMMDTIHHDFRGSLVNMQGFSKLLGMVGELNPKQSEYLQLIQDGIDEIASVTTDLLDVNRMIQEGGLKVQECDPKEIVEKALALIQAEARQKQVTFEQKLSTQGQSVVVDRIMVISALYHLLKQAIQNSHLGGSVTIEETLTGHQWTVSIQDAGRGISQIDIENLTQNHYADKNSPGLSLVYRIARFHQGVLKLESELGKGTKYILQLPCCD